MVVVELSVENQDHGSRRQEPRKFNSQKSVHISNMLLDKASLVTESSSSSL